MKKNREAYAHACWQEQEQRRAAAFTSQPEARLEREQLRGALYAVLLAICDNPEHSHGNRNIRIMEDHFLNGMPVKDVARKFGLAQREVNRVVGWVRKEAPRHRALLQAVLEPPATQWVPFLPLHPHVLHGSPAPQT